MLLGSPWALLLGLDQLSGWVDKTGRRRLSERESELVVAEEVRLSGLSPLFGAIDEGEMGEEVGAWGRAMERSLGIGEW